MLHADPLKDFILYHWNARDNKNVKTLQFALVGGLLVLFAGQGVSLRREHNMYTLRYLTLSTWFVKIQRSGKIEMPDACFGMACST